MDHKFTYNWKLSETVFSKGRGTVFSCFAGGGGSSMGYKLAGFDVIGCNEIDPKMMECYRENLHPKYSYLEPIQTFKLRDDLPDELFHLDILDGSPPCSNFSIAGNREKDWGKEKVFREGQQLQVLDTLFFDFIDLVKRLQPKIVIAENVKGLCMGEAWNYVRRIYKEFEEAGYNVQDWLLDASKMGVPQRRERIFFVGLRNDLCKPFLYQKDMFTLKPKLKLEFNEKEIKFQEIYTKEENRKKMQEVLNNAYDYCIQNNTADFAKYYETTTSKRKYFNTRLIFKNNVCDTIKSDCTHIIEGEKAYINETELRYAGTWPIDYVCKNNKIDYLIGMSVPPVMIAQIASEIYSQWLSKIEREI